MSSEIEVKRSRLLVEDSFFVEHLVGCRVYAIDGKPRVYSKKSAAQRVLTKLEHRMCLPPMRVRRNLSEGWVISVIEPMKHTFDWLED